MGKVKASRPAKKGSAGKAPAAFAGLPLPPGSEAPVVHPDELRVYRDALARYNEAADNLAKCGSVTGHPKTGAPMVNPFLDIQERAARVLERFHRNNPGWKG